MRIISIGGSFNAQIQEARYHIVSVSIHVVLQYQKWKLENDFLSQILFLCTAPR